MCLPCSVHPELCSLVSTGFESSGSVPYCVVGPCGTQETNHLVSQIVPLGHFGFPPVTSNLASLFLWTSTHTSLGPEQLHLLASETCWSPRSARQLCGLAADLCETQYTWCSSKGRHQVWMGSSAVSDQYSWCCLALLFGKDSDYSSPTRICTDNALEKSGT